MEHIKIIQGTSLADTEDVSMQVIQKLYEIASGSTLDNTSDLQGRLHITVAYREPVEWLTTHFPNLQISADDYAIPFEDPNMLAYLNSIGVGSNGMVTEAQAAAATVVANSQNTTVRKFNELKYFTGITESRGGWTGGNSGYVRFANWTALEEVDISNFISLGHTVGSAYEDTFSGCTNLKKVKASDKLEKIGYNAFDSCEKLEEITGLSGTIMLHSYAFYGCKKLKNSTFANCAFTFYNNYSYGAFMKNELLTSINIASGETQIPYRTFRECTALTTVNLPSSLTSIGEEAFRGCSSLPSIDLSNVTYIGNSAFYDCAALTSVDLSNVTTIKLGAFVASGLTGEIIVPNASDIEDYVFASCRYITKLDFTGSTFTQLNISVTENIANLQKVILPDTLTHINRGNLVGCSNLQYIKCLATTPPTVQMPNDFTIHTNCKLYVPDAAVSDYESSSSWAAFSGRIYSLTQFATDFPNG